MVRIYALANQKGGVGKTTTAVNLSAYLAAAGRRVLLVDMDPQANATSSLQVDKNALSASVYEGLIQGKPLADVLVETKHQGLHVIPSTPALAGAEVEMVNIMSREARLRRALAPLLDKYNYVLIDPPPSLGLLTINALTAAQSVIIPIQCEYLALEGLTQLLQTIKLVRENLNPGLTIRGILLTMFDTRTNLSQQVVEQVRQYFPGRVFRAVIPRSVRLSEAPSYGEPILTYAANSAGALAYQALAHEILAADEPKA